MRVKKTGRNYITPIFFVVLIFAGGIHYIFALINMQDITSVRSKSAITAFFEENIFGHDFWIESYGFVQKCMGKRQIEKFEIYKTDYESLVAVQKEHSSRETGEKVDAVYPIISHIEDKNIPYYYLTSILPVQDVSDLPYGVTEGSHVNQQLTENALAEKNVNMIELSEAESVKAIPKEKLFYRTDHHWTLETCFAAYQKIINTMENDLGWDLNARETADRSNYSEYRIKDSFLGSYGIKVGKYYAGKDDFVVYIPDFETDILFQSYDTDGKLLVEKAGGFYQALLKKELLEDTDYKNKLSAVCNQGCIENHVINHNAPNSLKCLLISHSYGRPLTMYLAMNFSEVVNLDPQKGRYEGSYIDYINDYKPDIVLFLVEFEGEIIGEYQEER